MNKFKYKARNHDGKLLTGIVEAVDQKQAVSLLRERGLVVISLGETTDLNKMLSVVGGVGVSQLANFTRQLATMINAGLSLVDSLNVLENQLQGRLKRIVADVRREVESGKPLSKAMETQSRVFDDVYVSLIKAGEAGGMMDTILLRLAENLEKKREFQSKVRGALLYPIIILIGMIVVAIVMVFYIIPQLTDLYNEFDTELPLVTSLLISFSAFAVKYWWLMLIGTIAAVVGWIMAYRNRATRRKMEIGFLSAPVFGELWEQIRVADLARTLAMLVSAGVPIVDSLYLSAKVSGSVLFEDGINNSAKLVEKGVPLAGAFGQQEYFPPLLTQMVQVGEETGQVDELLERIAKYFQTESEQKVKNLTTALEPIILILLGGGVGFLVFAVVMPIYNLTTNL